MTVLCSLASIVFHLHLHGFIEALPNIKLMALLLEIFGNFRDIIRYTFPVSMIVWIVSKTLTIICEYYESIHSSMCHLVLFIDSKVYILGFANIFHFPIYCLFLSFRKHLTHPYNAKKYKSLYFFQTPLQLYLLFLILFWFWTR